MKKLFARSSAAAFSMMVSAAAFANTTGGAANNTYGGTSNAFDDFKETVMSWAQGPLGTGIAVTMMLMGAGMGIARNSPMPALSGIAGAAFLSWGPGIIESLTNGALV